MLNFLAENWYLIIVAIAVIAIAAYSVYVFVKRPTSEQLAKVKEWLLYAVTEAEKALGSGTGQIKLRYVYDMFLTKFPFLTQVVSFENFSKLVDEALDQFRTMLETNAKLQEYVKGTTEEVKTEE